MFIQKRFSLLFSICVVFGTLTIWPISIWLKLEGVGFSDSWSTTMKIILDTLPWSGVSAVILAIIVVKMADWLSALLSDKVNEESGQSSNSNR